jgi:hypothetical protein
MTFMKQTLLTLGVSIMLTFVGFLTPSIATAQVRQESASSLIKFLNRGQYATDQFGRHLKVPIGQELAGCGDRGDRGAAVSLARLGGTIIPLLEEALDSIEKNGLESEYARSTAWLSLAYARNMGPAAAPRLRRLIANPKLGFFRTKLDHSVALSLGITSYVTESAEGPFQCRLQEPRDPLNELILAWKKNDRKKIEENLGPNAKAALKSLLKGRDWEVMRAHLWFDKSAGGSMGFSFGIAGRWSEPEETLEPEKTYAEPALLELLHPELVAHFKNRLGDDCGSHPVSFLRTDEEDYPHYLVDNSDLRELLRLIATCAANK